MIQELVQRVRMGRGEELLGGPNPNGRSVASTLGDDCRELVEEGMSEGRRHPSGDEVRDGERLNGGAVGFRVHGGPKALMMKTMVMMAMVENTAQQQQQHEVESIAPQRQREDEESNSSVFPHVVAASRTGNVVTSSWTGNVVTSSGTGNVVTSWTGNVVTSSGTGNVVTSWTGNVVAHTKLVMMMDHGESMMTNQPVWRSPRFSWDSSVKSLAKRISQPVLDEFDVFRVDMSTTGLLCSCVGMRMRCSCSRAVWLQRRNAFLGRLESDF
jgi:hypothetical protein